MVFLILLACYGYFFPALNNWGSNSRMDLTYALGDQGVVWIDDYHRNTGDKAFFQGHYFTEKSIGPSLLGLPFYLVFKALVELPPLASIASGHEDVGALPTLGEVYGEYELPEPGTPGSGHPPYYHAMALSFVTFFVVSVPGALLGMVVFLFASRLTTRDGLALLLALAFGLGTAVFAYGNEFFQHVPAAFGAFVGLFLLWRVVEEGASRGLLWIVGTLFGFAAATEYVLAPLLLVLSGWAVLRTRNAGRAAMRMLLGASPWIVATVLYNLAAFKTPLPVGYRYSSFASVHDLGFYGLVVPSLEPFLGITISPFRGVFFLSPFLVLAPLGLIIMWRRGKGARTLAILITLATVVFLVYNMSYSAWSGGSAVGPRHLIPMLPLLSLPVVVVLARATRIWEKLGIAVLFLASIANVWIQSLAGTNFPPEEVKNPLFEHSLPLATEGELGFSLGTVLGLDGSVALLPLALLLGAILLLAPRAEQAWQRWRGIPPATMSTSAVLEADRRKSSDRDS